MIVHCNGIKPDSFDVLMVKNELDFPGISFSI